MRVGAQQLRALVAFPDLGAVPAFGLGERLQRAAERFVGRRVLGEAPREAVLEPQQPLDALLRRDIAADAAIAGEVALGVEHGLAGGEHVAAIAIVELAPHQDIAERLARLERRAMRVPAAFDLDAGFPAALAEDALGERLLDGVAASHLHARESQFRVLLPVPVARQAADDAARRALRRSASFVLRLRHPLPPAPLYYSRWAIEFA